MNTIEWAIAVIEMDNENDEINRASKVILAEMKRLKHICGPLAGHICLLCGRTEPCTTDAEEIAKGGPGAPCTFDPTPKQLWENNKKLRSNNTDLRRKLDAIVKSYDAYRARGVLPGADEYFKVVASIAAARSIKGEVE
jgi:DNA repair exonuclease SbcCD ATPase subunit